MCMIIVKPKGVEMPPDTHIVNSFGNNSDGFGLAFWGEGMPKVHIEKGATKIKEVFKMIDSIPSPINKHIIMHFRFATTGSLGAGNCHPFPITNNIGDLLALKGDFQRVIAHNGVILETSPNFSSMYNNKNWDEELSDTQNFIIEYLADMGKAIYNNAVIRMIEDFTQSKFAIFEPNHIKLIGEFYKDGGRYYSNDGYKQVYAYTTTATQVAKVVAELDSTPRRISSYRENPKTKKWEVNPYACYGHCDMCSQWAHLEELEDLFLCQPCRKAFVTEGVV